jgi:hypothetical protein
VLIAKTNVNEEINNCIIDGKVYVNKVEYSNTTGCLNTRLVNCNMFNIFTDEKFKQA